MLMKNNSTPKSDFSLLSIKGKFLAAALFIGVVTFLFFIFLYNNDLRPSNLVYSPATTSSPARLIVSYTEENCGGDTGCDFIGYALRVIDPETGKKLSEVRYPSNDNSLGKQIFIIPTNNTIWMIKPRSTTSTGFLIKYHIDKDGKLDAGTELPELKEGTIEKPSGELTLNFGNRYNEAYCLDLKTSLITKGNCEYGASYYPPSNRFFTVSREEGSTRRKLYYWKGAVIDYTTKEVSVTMSDGDQRKNLLTGEVTNTKYQLPPLPESWGFSANRNSLTEAVLDNYRQKDPAQYAEVQGVFTQDYLISPWSIYQDNELCVIKAQKDVPNNTEGNIPEEFLAISKTGQVLWRIDSPFPANYSDKSCVQDGNKTVITIPGIGAFAIDNRTGKQAWLYKL